MLKKLQWLLRSGDSTFFIPADTVDHFLNPVN